MSNVRLELLVLINNNETLNCMPKLNYWYYIAILETV